MRLDYYLYAALNAVEHKQHVQAFFLLELCNEIDPTNPTVCSLRGSYFQNLFGDQKALPLLRQAFEGSPDDYWYRYVVTAYEAGQRKQAMKALEQMEKRQPKNIDILELHTHILKHEKQYDKALEVLDKIDKLTGEPTPYSVVTRFEMLQEAGDNNKAIHVLDDYLKRNPNDGRIHAMRTDISLRQAYLQNDTVAGKKLLDKQLGNPEVPVATKLKKFNQYKQWLSYSPTEERVILQGLLILNPANSELREQVANAMRDDSTTTDEQYRLFIEDSYVVLPDDPKWGYMKALLCYRDNDIDSMLIVLERAISHAEEPTVRLSLLVLYGDMLGQQGDYAHAFEAYEEVLQLQPDHLGTLNNYAWSLAISGGDLKKAEKMSQRTIQKDGNNPTFLDTYAWILHLQGQDTLALFYIRKALEYAGELQDNTLNDHYQIILQATQQ